MIAQGYQLWYDRTVSPTLTCLYRIINAYIYTYTHIYVYKKTKKSKEENDHLHAMCKFYKDKIWSYENDVGI